jgi:Fe-S-cluster containining protein
MQRKDEPVGRLATLLDEVDANFAVIQERQAARMQCRAGCSACCRARLSITDVEEAFLRRGLATFSNERRAELSARTREENREMCPALDDDGRCGIYPFRPLICRTYGVPLRHRGAVALVNPPVIEVCDLNFTETSLEALPPGDVLDQTALVERLEAIDSDHRAAHDLPGGHRIPIALILE